MIYSMAILPIERKAELVVKCPPGALLRKTLIANTTAEVQAEAGKLWGEFTNPETRLALSAYYVQLDIIEGRKPSGFSAAAKAEKLGFNVVVTRKFRDVPKEEIV